MTIENYRKLVGDAQAFQQAAWLIEKEISRLNLNSDSPESIGGPTSWRSCDVWKSLKTVSHFNFGIAFELRLKCLLTLRKIKPKQSRDGHQLAVLYDDLPCDISQELEVIFHHAKIDHPFDMKAFTYNWSPVVPEEPDNKDMKTLRGFCVYLDDDVKLWKKRYAWEETSEGIWDHYLDNLGALMVFLNQVGKLGDNIAREAGVIK